MHLLPSPLESFQTSLPVSTGSTPGGGGEVWIPPPPRPRRPYQHGVGSKGLGHVPPPTVWTTVPWLPGR